MKKKCLFVFLVSIVFQGFAAPRILPQAGSGDMTLLTPVSSVITLGVDSIPINTLPVDSPIIDESRILRFTNLTDGQILPIDAILYISAEVGNAFHSVELITGDYATRVLQAPPYIWESYYMSSYIQEGPHVFNLVAYDEDYMVVKTTSITIFAKKPTKSVAHNVLHIGFEEADMSNWKTDGSDYGVVPTLVSGMARSGKQALALNYSSSTSGHHIQNLVDSLIVPFGHKIHVITHSATSNYTSGTYVPAIKLGDWGPTAPFLQHSDNNTFIQKAITFTNTKGDSLSCFPRLRSKAINGACTIYYDDIVMYTDNNYYTDITAPSNASNLTIANTNFLRWIEGNDGQTGLKYTYVLRTSNAETASPKLNNQASYMVGDTIGEWVIIDELAAGVETYKDTTQNESPVNYSYGVFHRDVVYNYSKPVIVNNGVTAKLVQPLSVTFSCIGVRGGIHLGGLPQGQLLSVYNINGAKVVYNARVESSSHHISLPQGLYIVKVSGAIIKVAVM